MKNSLLLVYVIAFFGQLLFAQDASDSDIPFIDNREQVLLYGIRPDIITTLEEFQREKIGSYNELLLDIFLETRDSSIQQGIFRVWELTSFEDGLMLAREQLNRVLDDDDYSESVVNAAIGYLVVMTDKLAIPPLLSLVENQNTKIATAAIRAVGKIGIEEMGEAPEELLKRLQETDPLAEEDLVAALISTLGELRYAPAADELLFIVEDTGASIGHRRMACIALGMIGREDDYPVIERIYLESEDALLRSFALSGLAEFQFPDIDEIMVQALKRDAFWKIRVTAAEKLLGNNDDKIQKLLRYKAIKDPVNHVRTASIKALGASSDKESHELLLEIFTDDNYDTELRLASLKTLTENEILGAIGAIEEVMEKRWKKDKGRFLEFTCRDLSRSDWLLLAPLYERMLEHESWLLVIYGIRGIRRNKLSQLEEKIQLLDTEDERIRREMNLSK